MYACREGGVGAGVRETERRFCLTIHQNMAKNAPFNQLKKLIVKPQMNSSIHNMFSVYRDLAILAFIYYDFSFLRCDFNTSLHYTARTIVYIYICVCA